MPETYLATLLRELKELEQKKPRGWQVRVASRKRKVKTLEKLAKACLQN